MRNREEIQARLEKLKAEFKEMDKPCPCGCDYDIFDSYERDIKMLKWVLDVETPLKQAVARFKRAEDELDAASNKLDVVVQPIIDKLVVDSDIDGLNELVDVVPNAWKGSRKIYQRITELEIEMS